MDTSAAVLTGRGGGKGGLGGRGELAQGGGGSGGGSSGGGWTRRVALSNPFTCVSNDK